MEQLFLLPDDAGVPLSSAEIEGEESRLRVAIAGANCYAGIGSRSVPGEIASQMERIAAKLANLGLLLRSGGSPGSDSAFERGCESVQGKREIYLPWAGFNQHPSLHHEPPAVATEMAERYHPNWAGCSAAAHKLHARNCQQILGRDLASPVDFVVFYASERKGRVSGGTAMAVAIAVELGIPIFNLWRAECLTAWQRVL